MKRVALSLFLCFSAGLVSAANLTLECSAQTKSSGGPFSFLFFLVVDEETGKVTHTPKGVNSAPYIVDGLFSPKTIDYTFKDFGYEYNFTINKKVKRKKHKLTVTSWRFNSAGERIGPFEAAGSCKVLK